MRIRRVDTNFEPISLLNFWCQPGADWLERNYLIFPFCNNIVHQSCTMRGRKTLADSRLHTPKTHVPPLSPFFLIFMQLFGKIEEQVVQRAVRMIGWHPRLWGWPTPLACLGNSGSATEYIYLANLYYEDQSSKEINFQWRYQPFTKMTSWSSRKFQPICLTSLTRAKCGTRSTLCWKNPNISGSI